MNIKTNLIFFSNIKLKLNRELKKRFSLVLTVLFCYN